MTSTALGNFMAHLEPFARAFYDFYGPWEFYGLFMAHYQAVKIIFELGE